MRNRLVLSFLLGILLIGFSFGVSAIQNSGFESTQSGYSGCYFTNCINLTSDFPTYWDIYLPAWSDSFNELIGGNVMNAGSNIDSYEGSYSYSNAYYPFVWNNSFSSNYGQFYTTQAVSGLLSDSVYEFSGKIKIVSNELLNSSFAEYLIDTNAFKVSFNLSSNGTWEDFNVKYDKGVCSIVSGGSVANITECNTAEMSEITIITSFVFEQAQDYGLNHTEALFLIDDLKITTYTSALDGVGDYYDTYQQSLTGYSYTGNGDFLPTSSCTKIYSGKIHPDMKTRYIDIFFDNCSMLLGVGGGSHYATETTELGVEELAYFNGTDWVADTTFNNFEIQNYLASVSGYTTTSCQCSVALTEGIFFSESGDNDGGMYERDLHLELILPQNQSQFRIKIITCTGKGYSGCTGYSSGYATIYFNMSDVLEYSETPIYTGNAFQDVPTFFPAIVQYAEQETKNLTSYHLNLHSQDDYDDSRNLYWESQLMQNFAVNNIPNNSYDTYLYDTSSWAIQTGDAVWYNGTATYEYFGESYLTSSVFYFNQMDFGLCPSYCDNGNLYDGESGSNLTCSYTIYDCHPDCVPESDELNITLTAGTDWINAYFLNVGTTDYYYELKDGEGNVVGNGTPLGFTANFTGLESDKPYSFFLNGSNYYACDKDYYSYAEIYTKPFSDEGVPEYVAELGDSMRGFVNSITGFFYYSFGFSETLSKALLWIVITIAVSVLVGVKLGDGKSTGLVITSVVMLILGFLLGWLPVGIGVVFIILTGAVGMMMLRKVVV